MDTIGLITAWVGVVSFLTIGAILGAANSLITPIERFWAKTSALRRERRIQRLVAEVASIETIANADLFDLISLFGSAVLTLVTGIGVIVFSIQVLDLGPSLLAASLPFNIDGKIITRTTGILLFLASYILGFRLCYLAGRISVKLRKRKPGYIAKAMAELQTLQQTALPNVASQTVPH